MACPSSISSSWFSPLFQEAETFLRVLQYSAINFQIPVRSGEFPHTVNAFGHLVME